MFRFNIFEKINTFCFIMFYFVSFSHILSHLVILSLILPLLYVIYDIFLVGQWYLLIGQSFTKPIKFVKIIDGPSPLELVSSRPIPSNKNVKIICILWLQDIFSWLKGPAIVNCLKSMWSFWIQDIFSWPKGPAIVTCLKSTCRGRVGSGYKISLAGSKGQSLFSL